MRISNISIEKVVIEQEISILEDLGTLNSNISNALNEMGGIYKIPRNSYLASRISDGLHQIKNEQIILWPFFSSHLSLPLKVGETAWCIFDRDIKYQGWWITRIHSSEDGEDLAYSCYDRRFLIESKKTGTIANLKYDERSASKSLKRIFSYNTSTDIKDTLVRSNSLVKFEPVPKFTKRSGDFVIQGSNNSLICLGTDRYWKKEDDISSRYISPSLQDNSNVDLEKSQTLKSNAYLPIKDFSGTIDIVAGRGRSLTYDSTKPKRTASEIYKHENLDFSEIEKGRLSSFCEGDPDFYYDAARLYVSMKTIVDDALSLKNYIPILPSQDTQKDFVTGSAVFAKADHIRLVARKDDEINVNGTIKIIKEGHVNKELAGDLPLDGCSISLLEDGAIHVAGQKIFLGLSTKDTQVEETWIGGGEKPLGLTQPYVKFQELKQLFIDLICQIGELRTDVESHIKKFNSHTHNGTCPTGGPITTLPITSKASLVVGKFMIDKSLSTESNQYDEMIEKLKSTRIFGE
jgi:hypothetical protein